MPRKPSETPSSKWSERKPRFATIQIRRDLAGMLKEIALDSQPVRSIADLVDQLIRPTVAGMYRTILEQKLKEIVPAAEPAPAKKRSAG